MQDTELTAIDKETLKRLVLGERARIEAMRYDSNMRPSDLARIQPELDRLSAIYNKLSTVA